MKEIIYNMISRFYSIIARIEKKISNHYWSEKYKNEFKSIGSSFSILRPNRIINGKCITIGNSFFSLYNLRIEAIESYANEQYSPEILIGDNVDVNTDCHIAAINKIFIGNNVLIASKVFITDHSHGEINSLTINIPPSQRKLYSKGPVIIEDNVWIGENVCILSGVKIGKNSIIGANSVVSKDIPRNSVAVGIPAKVLKNIY